MSEPLSRALKSNTLFVLVLVIRNAHKVNLGGAVTPTPGNGGMSRNMVIVNRATGRQWLDWLASASVVDGITPERGLPCAAETLG